MTLFYISAGTFLTMLEPVLGIIIGVIAFNEIVNLKSVVGCISILLSVFIISVLSKDKKNKSQVCNIYFIDKNCVKC